MDVLDGMKLIDTMPNREALVISRTNQITRSSGWKAFVS
jgi:hypothetical protein